MERIDRIDLTLEDKMRVLALTFHFGKEQETLRFDTNNKFHNGKLRTNFIANATWTCINHFFPEEWLSVKAFFTNMRKVRTATRRLLEEDRKRFESDEQGNEAYVDITEELFVELIYRSELLSKMNIETILSPAYLYFELYKTLRGFGNDKEDRR